MSLVGMPILILNLGGEMIYILDQRLKAQNIPADKGIKVLQDVVSAMFTPEFIEELFKPQELYSAKSARQIFDKLAHSSIMRLSVSSMNKLYDLMTMGFKYQLVACNHCGELLEVTLNHLMSVMQMVDSGPAQESVRRATELVTHRYAGMSGTDFCLLRQTLCTHLQDKRIKVSLFLQDGIQRPDGSFVLTNDGPTPPNVEVPGEIRYSDGTVDRVSLPTAEAAHRPRLVGPLGANVYNKDRSALPPALPPAPPPAAAAAPPPAAAGSVDPSAMPTRRGPSARKGTGTEELNFLASLIGDEGVSQQAGSAATKMSMNLFDGDALFEDVGGSGGSSTVQGQSITINVDRHSSKGHLADVMASMSVEDEAAAGERGEDDDLLDLLDGA